jgi:hypothetical protein
LTVLAATDNKIKAVCHVNKSSNVFLTVAGNLDELNKDNITKHQKWIIQQKAQCLALALQLARENMNAGIWQNCFEHTIGKLQRQGLTLATRHEITCGTVAFARFLASTFRNQGQTFRHLSIKIQTSVQISRNVHGKKPRHT